MEDITQVVEHHVKYIAHLAFSKWMVGIGLLLLTLIGVVVSAGIGPVRIPPAVTARVLLSHLPGLGYLTTRPKTEISNQIDILRKQMEEQGDNDALSSQIDERTEKLRDLENYEIWIWQGRMPRILVALLVGAGLSVSGVIFQGLVLNPLASSGTLGVSGGAAAGASLLIVFGAGLPLANSALAIPAAAFAGGLATLGLVWFVARSGRGTTSPLSLILAGVIVGIFLGSAMSFVRIVAEEESLRALTLWGVGSLAGREWVHVSMAWPIIVVGILSGIVRSRDLNVLSLGAQQARHIGVNVNRSRQILMVTAALLTAGAVSVSGPIGFVGLVVPHSVRMLVGPDHRTLIPFCALGGGFFLLFCDTIGRTIASPLELPVGIVTSLIGAPFFVYIYKTRMRGGAVIA
jgi:iron complex transport system permease protein